MPPRVKVLFLAANPVGLQSPLRLDHEIRGIVQAIRSGPHRDRLEVAAEWAVRTGDLQTALMRHEPQVVHFAGHGSGPEGIYLEDERGDGRAVGTEALRGLFAVLNRSLRVVVLNACETLSTIEGFHELVDYTIGMRQPVSDHAAALFAESFYGALAFGRSVEDAFALGVSRLRLEGIPEADTPTLLVREGAAAGPLVAAPDPPPEPTPDAETRTAAAERTGGARGGFRIGRVNADTVIMAEGDHNVFHPKKGG